MKNTFAGLPAEGLAFLSDLKKHNDREWFQPRKPVFEETVRQPMLTLIAAIHREMARFAPAYAGDPAKSLYRIYRDTRFSKNKAPYKTYTSALFWHNALPKDQGAAFYFGVSPEGIDIGAGLYEAEPTTLHAIRSRIAENPGEFRAAFETRRVRKFFGELRGASLTRVPKGFDARHPAMALLKQKQFLLWAQLDARLATTPKLLPELVSRFEAAGPFVEYLNHPLVKRHARRRREERFFV